MRAERLLDGPIIGPELDPSIGVNIQGPSLIRVPDWIPDPLGRYYLYFADHKGSYIRLAYADSLTGPWRVHVPGSLQLADSGFLTSPPEVGADRLAEMKTRRGAVISHDLLTEITTPHIASPDVHVDEENRRIVMYYHGLADVAVQVSRVATSGDGIAFSAQPQILGRSYLRVFVFLGMYYAMAMPGQFYRSSNGLSEFEAGPLLFDADMRHSALRVKDGFLEIFYTQVGEAPERILFSRIELKPDWRDWKTADPVEILRPERDWEGADAPLTPSIRSTAYGHVNQLRDPAIYEEDGRVFLLYAVAGESGIAIAELHTD